MAFFHSRVRVLNKKVIVTSVFIVAMTALIVSATHIFQFIQAAGEELATVLSLVIFTAPKG